MNPGGQPLQEREAWTWAITLIAAIALWRLLIAGVLPLTRDEAYYYDWAGRLAWGYFDHPPAVALLGLGTWFAPGSALAARLGALLLGSASLLVLWRLYLASGLRAGSGLLLALLLAAVTFPVLLSGVITTPDTVLALCWPLALHEGLTALGGHRRRWLSAGLVTGIGLLGKYTMAAIGPVFLWALIRSDARALRTPWPYLGAAAALLVFLPNLLWNAANDWVTLRFQFGHGFSTATGPLPADALGLPAAAGTETSTTVSQAAMTPGERLSSLASFVGSEALFWGLVLLPIAAVSLRPGGLSGVHARVRTRLTPQARSLFGAAALFPLLFFGLVALGSDVEANWAALYLVAAAPFLALLLQPMRRWALAAAAANLLLASVYALHAATGCPPLPDSAQRIVRESHGFAALAAHAATLPAPVLADRYQFAAMLNFHQPRLEVTQWPGITRPSEYGRGRITPAPSLEALQRSGFWLVSRKFSPPRIPGFEAVATHSAYACPGAPLRVLEHAAGWEAGGCTDPANVWRLYRYRAEAATGAQRLSGNFDAIAYDARHCLNGIGFSQIWRNNRRPDARYT